MSKVVSFPSPEDSRSVSNRIAWCIGDVSIADGRKLAVFQNEEDSKGLTVAVIDKNGDTVPFLSIIDDETSDSPFGCAMHIYTNLSPYDTEGRFQQQSDIRHELLENGEQQKKR